MIAFQLKEKSVLPILFFLICSIPSFSCAEADKTSRKEINDVDYYYNLGVDYGKSGKYQEQ